MKNLQTAVIILFCIAIASVSCSCRSPVENDITKPLWETQIAFGSLIFADFPITESSNGVLFAGIKSPNTTLYLIDKKTGIVKWEWSDWLNPREDVLIKGVYLFENIVVFQNSPNAYGLDLNTGKPLWRFRHSGADRTTNGLGNVYFFTSELATVAQGNTKTGVFTNFYSLPTMSGFRFSLKTPLPFKNQNQDTLLVLLSGGLQLMNSSPAQGKIVLYNLTKKQVLYDSTYGNKQSFGNPVLANNKIYNDVGGGIQCNDLWTGKLLWRRDFDVSFLFSGVEVAEGKVFAGGEDTNFYCLDAETGNTLWTLKGVAGGTLKPFVMNGVVYFANGSLYAVDVNTGQILSKPYSPDGEGFFGRVTGSDGRIYAQSYKSAYCYKAAR